MEHNSTFKIFVPDVKFKGGTTPFRIFFSIDETIKCVNEYYPKIREFGVHIYTRILGTPETYLSGYEFIKYEDEKPIRYKPLFEYFYPYWDCGGIMVYKENLPIFRSIDDLVIFMVDNYPEIKELGVQINEAIFLGIDRMFFRDEHIIIKHCTDMYISELDRSRINLIRLLRIFNTKKCNEGI